MPTKILPCTCVSPYQDEKYKGRRVHNYGPAKNVWRCSVCATAKGASQAEQEKLGKKVKGQAKKA